MSFLLPPPEITGELRTRSRKPDYQEALRCVQKTLHRSLSLKEQNYVKSQFEKLDISDRRLSPEQLDTIYTKFANVVQDYFSQIRRKQAESDPHKTEINVKDMLNSILKSDFGQDGENSNSYANSGPTGQSSSSGSSSSSSSGSGGSGSNVVFIPNQIKSRTMLLDSRYRFQTESQSKLSWNVLFDTRVDNGYVNVYSDLNDITTIKIYPIKLPLVSEMLNNYGLVTLTIEEFSSQSIIAQENRQYMFMFQAKQEGRWLMLDPYFFNEGVFRLPVPARKIPLTLTLTFGTPLNPLVLDLDRQIATVQTYGTSTVLVFTDNHKLENGDNIYISNFTSLNTNRDSSVINAMNSSADTLFVTRLSDTTVSVDIDTSSLRVQGTGTVSATVGVAVVTGVGSNFISLLGAGDFIEIAGGQYEVAQVVSDTSLVLKDVFTGTNQAGVNYWRNNQVPNNILSVYFGSKRVFIQIEFIS